MDFTIGQGDHGGSWSVPVFDADGSRVDLTGATSVVLHYRVNDASAPAVEVTGAVTGVAPDTEASYAFQGSDTTTPGVFDAEWIITLASGRVLSYPECAGRPKLQFEVFEKP